MKRNNKTWCSVVKKSLRNLALDTSVKSEADWKNCSLWDFCQIKKLKAK